MRLRFFAVLALLSLAAFACASLAPTASTPRAAEPDTPALPTEFVPTVVTSTPTFAGCAYMWASEDLPELSRRLNAELQEISSDVSGLAYAFGENCVYEDGHATFGAMETDFRIGVKVKSVADEAALGDWIARVMRVIEALPPQEIQGPQPGRVDFAFKQPDPAELFVSVPIEKYRQEGQGLKGAALLRLFYPHP